MTMQTLGLFDDMVVDAPETEGIKYAGSKLKLFGRYGSTTEEPGTGKIW